MEANTKSIIDAGSVATKDTLPNVPSGGQSMPRHTQHGRRKMKRYLRMCRVRQKGLKTENQQERYNQSP